MKFSKKLIALRHAKGLSQQQLGEALKITPETINSWEVGTTTPDLTQLSKLADFFGLPLDVLMKDANKRAFDTPVYHMDDVPSTAANADRQRVIIQLEILSGALAAVCLLGTFAYLLAGII